MSGSEMQREKEKVAQKMREKQAAGEFFKEALHSRLLAELFQRMRRRLLRPRAVRRSRDDIDSSIEIFNDTRMVCRVMTEFSVRITMHEHERGLRLMRSLECVVEKTDNIHPFNIFLLLGSYAVARGF
jgi:hypothetical protein